VTLAIRALGFSFHAASASGSRCRPKLAALAEAGRSLCALWDLVSMRHRGFRLKPGPKPAALPHAAEAVHSRECEAQTIGSGRKIWMRRGGGAPTGHTRIAAAGSSAGDRKPIPARAQRALQPPRPTPHAPLPTTRAKLRQIHRYRRRSSYLIRQRHCDRRDRLRITLNRERLGKDELAAERRRRRTLEVRQE